MYGTLKPPAYSEAEGQRLDEEDRLLDDTSDGIDWDEITATTQPDFEAGRFAFNTEDYPRRMRRLRKSAAKTAMGCAASCTCRRARTRRG